MSMKNPLTPAGIEPATYRFVAQHLNHCATAVPLYYSIYVIYFTEVPVSCSIQKGTADVSIALVSKYKDRLFTIKLKGHSVT